MVKREFKSLVRPLVSRFLTHVLPDAHGEIACSYEGGIEDFPLQSVS
jgi:hypothetical protein